MRAADERTRGRTKKQLTSSKRRVTRREAGGWRGAQATAGRKRQEHDGAGEEVEGKGRAGEAKRAARPHLVRHQRFGGL